MPFRNVHIKDSQQLIISLPNKAKSLKWEPFWEEVDLAERMLVSGMFEDAARMASDMLDRLQSAEVADSWVAQQGEEMTEQVVTYASGNGRGAVIASMTMVLIQAHHQMDRHEQLNATIRSKFNGVARVPPQAFLAWVCLQVAALEFKLARSALEGYLDAAAAYHASAMKQLVQEGVSSGYTVSPRTGPLVPRSPLASGEQVTGATGFDSSSVVRRRRAPPTSKSEIVIDVAEHITEGAECLTLEEYEVLVGVYTREVLSRGLGDPSSAADWLTNGTNLLAPDRREVLINQVRGIETTLLGVPSEVSGRTRPPGARDEEAASQSRGGQASASGEAPVARPGIRTFLSGREQATWASWIAALRVWLRVKYYGIARKARNLSIGNVPFPVFCRCLALAMMGGLLSFAAFRKRQAISRLIRRAVNVPRGILIGILETVREEIDEFWQLAFNGNSTPGATLPRLQGNLQPRATTATSR